MKRTILSLVLLSFVFIVKAQNVIDGFTTTPQGVIYKIQKANPDGQRIKEGDLVIGRFAVYYDDSLIFNGMNRPAQPVFPVVKENNVFKGDLIDGLRMMHVGEITTFAFPKDTMTKYPTGISKDVKAKYILYKVSVDFLTTLDQMQKEEQARMAVIQKEADSLRKIEALNIANYIKTNGWNKKAVEGIFVKHLKAGKGPKAKKGDRVKINYTGQLLDGKVFDTSIESVAKENNKYNANRKYEPLEFVIGKGQMIKGFEIAAKQLNKGGKVIVLIPSDLAYGNRDMGEIKPYSPLLFTIELVDISK